MVIDEPEAFEVRLERYERMIERQREAALEEQALSQSPRDVPPAYRLFISRAEAELALERFQRVIHSNLPFAEAEAGHAVHFRTSSLESVEPTLEAHLSNIATRQAEEYAVHIVCDNDGQVDRLDEVLRERGLAAIPLRDAPALEA
ncbi:MAG: hypothetical protein NTW86_26340, partial [Candidatus Sumerlaeota bacterium]|nr:hypothetical protein [Candidatus Sumerlaeota bacterium]